MKVILFMMMITKVTLFIMMMLILKNNVLFLNRRVLKNILEILILITESEK